MGSSASEEGASGDESRRFVTTRLRVMLENMIEQTEEVDAFDYLSKLLLEMYQRALEKATPEEALKTIVKSKNQMLGRLLVKAMKD